MTAFPAQLLNVLRQLSPEVFLSGEEVARRLGCSRATVNNAIRAAAQAGIPVHAVHGRGYRLARPVSWLDGDRLSNAMARRGVALRHLDQVGSTNAHLLEWAASGAPHRAVVSAEWQSQGRGRRGRTWHAGLGCGLMFSLLWRSNRPAAELSGLSLAVGVALAKALGGLGLRSMVKWPNDIQVDGAKLAGVLIELSGDMLGPSAAVIGVGVNVLGADALTGQVGQPVTDLHRHLGVMDRNELLLALVAGLDAELARFEQGGFAVFREEWQACHAHQGKDVLIHSGQAEPIMGRAVGVDEQGALLLDTGSELRRFHSGDVSLRGVDS
jgi:BirA family biotin operon repressor/biotin-[acetyl-CoA-carboxylase] ligase